MSTAQEESNRRRRLAAVEAALSNKRTDLRDLRSRLSNSLIAADRGDGVLGSPRLQDELRTRIAELEADIANIEGRADRMADWLTAK